MSCSRACKVWSDSLRHRCSLLSNRHSHRCSLQSDSLRHTCSRLSGRHSHKYSLLSGRHSHKYSLRCGRRRHRCSLQDVRHTTRMLPWSHRCCRLHVANEGSLACCSDTGLHRCTNVVNSSQTEFCFFCGSSCVLVVILPRLKPEVLYSTSMDRLSQR